MSEMVPEEDPSEVAVAVERWLARGGKSRRSLARHLERRGFSKRHILDALESVQLPG